MNVYWLQQTARDVPAGNYWLGPREMLRLEGIHVPKRRADWRLGRWTAKHSVAAWLHLSRHHETLADIEILPAPGGAPLAFFDMDPAPVTISISHRQGVAACALAEPGVALGCDLEIIEPHCDAFAEDYFTAPEQQMFAEAPIAGRFKAMALLWSAKESVLKAVGMGLRIDTRQVSVQLIPMLYSAPENEWHPLQGTLDGRQFRGWWLYSGTCVRTLMAAPAPGRPLDMLL